MATFNLKKLKSKDKKKILAAKKARAERQKGIIMPPQKDNLKSRKKGGCGCGRH